MIYSHFIYCNTMKCMINILDIGRKLRMISGYQNIVTIYNFVTVYNSAFWGHLQGASEGMA